MKLQRSTVFSGAIGTRLTTPAGRGPSWLTRFLESIARHRKINRDYDLLLDMPDYMLHDLGLTRFEVRREKQRHNRIPPLWSL
ncbi:MAG: DUF1127 domain-containing protein [Pseudomonadota bacterium]